MSYQNQKKSEEDLYKITITDPNIKNFAVVLMQNTGQTS